MSDTTPPTRVATDITQDPTQTAHGQARIIRYRTYKDFYLGYQWEGNPKPGDVRLTFNYARVFVNKAASYLMSKPVSYDATADNPDDAREVERFLEEVSEHNVLPQLDLDEAISAGTLGDGAFTVRWDKEAKLPKVTAVDPSGLDCRWRTDDMRTLTWLRQEYWVSPGELSQQHQVAIAPQANQYDPVRAQEEWTVKNWSLKVAGQEIARGPNPYGVIPYIVFPNLRVPKEFWGESDLADLTEINRELNKRLSVFALLLDLSGYPVITIEGATEEETRQLRIGLGQLWTLPQGAKAEVLELLKAGASAAHTSYIELVYRTMHDLAEMPRTSFGDSSGEGTARSGVALEIELQPLLHKLARKHANWTSALKRRADLIIRIARIQGRKLPDAKLRVNWPPVLPQDRAALVTQEMALVGAGIHSRTKAMEILNDPDPERQLQQVLDEAHRLQQAGFAEAVPGQPGASGQGAKGLPNFRGAAGSGGGIVKGIDSQ